VAFVLDASAAMPWCFEDERTPETEHFLGLAMAREPIYVPSHWPMELLNGLTRAARRGRLDDGAVDRFLALLPNFELVVEERSLAEQWDNVLELVRTYRLSAYDAAYLSLAKRERVPLATLDEQLRLAAQVEQVSLLL
jgi:predicted nucleic acid-binding protein